MYVNICVHVYSNAHILNLHACIRTCPRTHRHTITDAGHLATRVQQCIGCLLEVEPCFQCSILWQRRCGAAALTTTRESGLSMMIIIDSWIHAMMHVKIGHFLRYHSSNGIFSGATGIQQRKDHHSGFVAGRALAFCDMKS